MVILLAGSSSAELEDLSAPITGADISQPILESGMSLQEMERDTIRRALELLNGRRKQTAAALGISVRTLQRKIKEYGLDPVKADAGLANSGR